MRLTLAEVAQCLCRGADNVLWHVTMPGLQENCAGPHSVLPCLKVYEDADGLGIDSIFASWSTDCPTGAEIDSRLVKPGYLFFCLSGENVDGHDFALKAAEAGAIGIVALHDPFESFPKDFKLTDGRFLPPVFVVQDVTKALQRLAMRHRDTTTAKVVAVTGTAGKTSVKEVLAQVLSTRGLTAKSEKNRNNQLGLPVSMLKAHADSSFWVMEAGISQPHDMQELGEIIRPDLALVLNVGAGHTEGLGDHGVAYYKAQLFDYVQDGGTVIYNTDFPALCAEVEKRHIHFKEHEITVLGFSAKNDQHDAFAEYRGCAESGNGIFRVRLQDRNLELQAPFISQYGAENVAAIACVAGSLGFRGNEIIEGLGTAKLPEQRFAAVQAGSFLLLDDSYNANPLSASRMLDAAKERASAKKMPFYVIFGEMKELGAVAEEEHLALGEHLGKLTPEVIFWKGGQVQAVKAGLKQAGYAGDFYPVAGGQEFAGLLEELEMLPGVVLFKGSRSNHLENLVEIFKGHVGTN